MKYDVYSNFNAEMMVLADLMKSPQAHQQLSEDDFSTDETKEIFKRLRMFTKEIDMTELKVATTDLESKMIDTILRVKNNNPDYWMDELMKASFMAKLKKLGRMDIIKQFTNEKKIDGTNEVELVWNDLYKNSSTMQMQELLKEQFNKVMNAFKVYDGLEPIVFDEEEEEDVDPIVEGIFYNASINAIIGQSKIGKSFLAHQLAFCVQNGYDFLQHKTKKCDVAVFDFEQTPKIIKQKMKSVQEEYGEGEMYQAYSVAGKVFSIDNIVEKIRNMKMHNPNLGMVILDCFYSFNKGDENKAEDVMKSLMPLTRIKEDLCIVYLHHTNKTGGNGVDLINAGSGSGFHGRFCDQTLVVTKSKNEYAIGVAGRVWYGEVIKAIKTENGLYQFESSQVGNKDTNRNKIAGHKVITNEELEEKYPEICKLIGDKGTWFGTIEKEFKIDKNTLRGYGFKITPKDKSKFKELAESGLKTEYVLKPHNYWNF